MCGVGITDRRGDHVSDIPFSKSDGRKKKDKDGSWLIKLVKKTRQLPSEEKKLSLSISIHIHNAF